MKSLRRPAALLAIFASDRATKTWASRSLAPRGAIALCRFFHLTYVQNTGAAFGIGVNENRFFLWTSLILLSAVLYLFRAWKEKGRWVWAGLTLVAGGALGNIHDRIRFGYVVDFLDFRVWPVFNVADSCITVGAVCLALGLSREERGP